MAVKETTKEEKKEITLFSKLEVLQSKKYREKVDLLNVLLEDDTKYSLDDVDKKIKEYMGKEVR